MTSTQDKISECYSSFLFNSNNLIKKIGEAQEKVYASINENSLGSHRDALYTINQLEKLAAEYEAVCNKYGDIIDARFKELAHKS